MLDPANDQTLDQLEMKGLSRIQIGFFLCPDIEVWQVYPKA
jgi:hypothetical protein